LTHSSACVGRGDELAGLATTIGAEMTRPKRPGNGSRRLAGEPPKPLNLAQFESVDDALAKIEPGNRYTDVGALLIPVGDGIPLNVTVMFWFSMISRCQGLHAAIARETRQGNPHAVWPLIRAFSEAVVLLIYVIDHPKYIPLVATRASELPKGSPKRKSIGALISYAKGQAPGMKGVYAELSEATHFGAVAMWASHTVGPEDESGMRPLSWTSGPGWRSDEAQLAACAQTLELADAMEILLRNFAGRYVLPLRDGTKTLPLDSAS
jgi:hypothetical protein